jgi:hypothetical protein
MQAFAVRATTTKPRVPLKSFAGWVVESILVAMRPGVRPLPLVTIPTSQPASNYFIGSPKSTICVSPITLSHNVIVKI